MIITDPVVETVPADPPQKIAIYTRITAAENKDKMEGQAKRLSEYCYAKGYRIHSVVKEIASGVKDARPKLLRLLTDPAIAIQGSRSLDRLDCGGTQRALDPFRVQLHPAIAGSNCCQL